MLLQRLRSVALTRAPTRIAYNWKSREWCLYARANLVAYAGIFIDPATLQICPNCMGKFNPHDPHAYKKCSDALALCTNCAVSFGTCKDCETLMSISGQWDSENKLHAWIRGGQMYCSTCRRDGDAEVVTALGENFATQLRSCEVCALIYMATEGVPDGYTDQIVCPRCARACSICARLFLCDGQSGIQLENRARCALCSTPPCSVCKIEVGLIKNICWIVGSEHVCGKCILQCVI